MSFSGTISNALSGMRMSSLAAELVSSNLANATNETYGPRALDVSSRSLGGVKANGVIRHVDPALLSDWRNANSARSAADTLTSYIASVESVMSSPDDPRSLTAKLAEFESALIAAEARPDLANRLEMVSHRAKGVTDTINDIADRIEQVRTRAEKEIGSTVERLNASLSQVAELNSQIARKSAANRDTSALLDQRQKALDAISEITSIRVLQREHGAVSVVAKGGAVLLEGTAPVVEFDAKPMVTAHMTIENGLLEGLTIQGNEISVSRLGGGKLEALFNVRDIEFPRYQTELDTLTAQLVTRFQSTTLDPTLAVGDAGLFTDRGNAFAPADSVGLSGRVSINDRIDPSNGGELRHLRDGFGAAVAGPVGDATILSNMISALNADNLLMQGNFAGQSMSINQHAGAMMSSFATDLSKAEDRLSQTTASQTALTEDKLRNGVDTDQELQTLMALEKAYAANAQVIRTVDEMLDVLMGI